ncbi:acyltransferase family protein [Aurantivibrio plasticivorans]
MTSTTAHQHEHMQTANAGERLHSLDAVRAIALLLGIFIHGTMLFLYQDVSASDLVPDNHYSDTLFALMFEIHVFRMSVFFLLAGFFAHLVFHRRGAKYLAKDRAKRILLPLIVFWLITFPLTAAALFWAYFKMYGSLDNLPEFSNSDTESLSLMHLWFLYVLLGCYLFAFMLRALYKQIDKQGRISLFIDACLHRLMKTPVGAWVLSIPVCLILLSIPEWQAAGGVVTPMVNLDVHWSTWLIYFYLFVIGWVLDRQRHKIATLFSHWQLNMIVGTGLSLAALYIIWPYRGDIAHVLAPDVNVIYAVIYGSALMMLTFGTIGMGVRFFTRESPFMRFLADGSYWVYLMHMPLIAFWQALFILWPVHWAIKYSLCVVLTAVPLYYLYNGFVRTTWVGVMLNGKRMARGFGVNAEKKVSQTA